MSKETKAIEPRERQGDANEQGNKSLSKTKKSEKASTNKGTRATKFIE